MDIIKNKNLILVAILITVVIIAYFLGFFSFIKKVLIGQQGRVIEEKLVIPETKNVTGIEGRVVNGSAAEVSLVPKNSDQKVIIPGAVLTLKGGYDLAAKEALKWSSDAKLVFIKSLSAVTLDGKSAEWQIVFGSANKKGGYEVVIQNNKIVSSKEIVSKIFGYNLPKNWYDSGDAIASLQGTPQFSNATMTGINFFYNADSKIWSYTLATSRGTTSMIVK